jgi:DHA2 family multidrug resistance protein
LISHVTNDNAPTAERIVSYTHYFQQKGIGLLDARLKAMKVIDLSIVKQSTLMSYIDSYFLIGLLFALALPLLLFVMKRTKKLPAGVVVSDH